MLTTERHFRVVQVFGILVVLTCIQVAMKVTKTSAEITPIQWVVIAMALWAIVSGFTLQRQIVGRPDRPRKSF